MLTEKDQINLEKATHSVSFLAEDLRQLHGADNPLLSELAYDLLEQSVAIKTKLDRLIVVTTEKPAQ